jgi:uncharacterized protein (TIGR03437 family)
MNWKSLCYRFGTRSVVLLSTLYFLTGFVNAQQSRITKGIDNQQRFVLTGHIHPKARAEDDQGRVSPSLQMSYVKLELAQSESQHADLQQLLKDQQTPASGNYHRWLTPEQYAERFGVSTDDLNTIVAWLQGQGLTIAAVARGRNWIAVNGEAATIESAFQTEIHQYVSNGETHFANASNPSVPAAFSGVIGAIRGLNDFRMKAKARLRKASAKDTLKPNFTSGDGETFITPGDLAVIYDINPLYADGINGQGQSIVVAGQTQVNLADIQQFRSSYGLPANNPQMVLVPGAQDPGISQTDLPEADLDLEWSGAVARNATIIFVYASDVMDAVQYAIDENLAPELSQSYGACELETPSSDLAAFQQMGQQANSQGMTWFAASGDTGAADCDDSQNPGLAVDAPGSTPEVTDMGGTEFATGGQQYWSGSNGANGVSALSYIPETSWNDSSEDGQPSASGGGASVYFSKPSWQTGPGVPKDNARDVPDLALSASPDTDGYFVYTGGSLQVYGGTSVPAPTFAGVIALLNQYLVAAHQQATPGLGNINPKLYSLAQTAPSAFHDVTTGNNLVTISCGRHFGCSDTPVGYYAGVGYDQVTGLGSVDVSRLITAWSGGKTTISLPSATSITLMSNLRTVSVTDAVFLIATVTGVDGQTPTGTVNFSVGGASLGSAALAGSGGIATATLTVSGSQLSAGSGTITAVYSQGSSSSVTASVAVSVSGASASSGTPLVLGAANGASFQHTYSPGMILSVFGSQLAPSAANASSVPLPVATEGVAATINNVAAPLYYVSPDQLNIQIPYETAVNQVATLRINNNGLIGSFQFNVAPAAPGIFTNASGALSPSGSANRGAIVSLYMTGAGAVNPQVATGAAPADGTAVTSLPVPSQNVVVTVDGVPAAIEFVGAPVGLVGVIQINFYVPTEIPDGTQPVVVTVGGEASAPAYLAVNN